MRRKLGTESRSTSLPEAALCPEPFFPVPERSSSELPQQQSPERQTSGPAELHRPVISEDLPWAPLSRFPIFPPTPDGDSLFTLLLSASHPPLPQASSLSQQTGRDVQLTPSPCLVTSSHLRPRAAPTTPPHPHLGCYSGACGSGSLSTPFPVVFGEPRPPRQQCPAPPAPTSCQLAQAGVQCPPFPRSLKAPPPAGAPPL